jgi:hypothetical protein
VRLTTLSASALALAFAGACVQPGSGRTADAQPAVRAAASAETLSFAISDGRTENRFFRQGRVAAHVLVTSGEAPRFVTAFPAGNMGVGVWFEDAAELSVEGTLAGVEREDGMRGVSVTIRTHAPALRVHRALLGSVRALRHPGRDEALLAGMENAVVKGPPLVVHRTTVDGKYHMALSIEPSRGSSATVDADGRITLASGPSGDIVVRMTALSDEEPLTPVATDSILSTSEGHDRRSLEVLSFLTYREKLLAGSWQYLSYFGRDTLLSTRLLMPVLDPQVIEAGLGSVLERLDADGEVAQEEDIGEWAALRNLERKPPPADLREPRYDRKMVDDDFILAPVLAAYVLDSKAGPSRAGAFFARRTRTGATFAEAAKKNLARVLAQAAPFAARPSTQTLVHIGDGLRVGNWRDSQEGLGNGRIPYDVNAALVPAALRAAERLYVTEAFGADRTAATRAGEFARAWTKAEALFHVDIDAEEARARVRAYAAEVGVDGSEALASITGPVSFPAVSLDAGGMPVPIMHSDDAFVMLFTEPSAEWLASAASRVVRPFPAGLRTPVGIVVANPAYARDASLRGLFTRSHYHGTVVWSWQQAMLLSGLRRQLTRTELPAAARQPLIDAEQALSRVVDATRATRTSELWSFGVDANGYHVVPYGQGKEHHTEANAAQLWSTGYLALDGPASAAQRTPGR